MKKVGKWLILLVIIMFISFIISGFFFLKSGLMDFENGGVNGEVVIELEKTSFEFNKLFGIPIEYENCYQDWCVEEDIQPIN